MITIMNKKLLSDLSLEAAGSARRRKNLNLHHANEDTVHKLFNAMQTDSYVRPHRHVEQEKTELLIAVQGRFVLLTFNEQGVISERLEFAPGGEVFGAEIQPGTWHTVLALAEGSVFIEVKQGPYTPLTDKDFAAWAPAENTPAVTEFMAWLRRAEAGEQSSFL